MHIGYEKANHDKIIKFFVTASIKADLVILDGDTFDLWRTPYKKILYNIKPQFHAVMDALQRAGNMTRIIIIPGNHDFNLKKIWGIHEGYNIDIMKDIIIRDPIHGSMIFTHGWQFDIKQRFGSFAYGWLVYKFPYLYQRYFKGPSQVIGPRSNVRSKQVRKIHDKAGKHARQHDFNYIVMGHTHVPGIHGKVVDCGDFIDSCSYVEIDNGKPELKYL